MILSENKSKSVDVQVLYNALTLSIIAPNAFGTDFETNAHAKDVFCRVFAEVLDTTEYRTMHILDSGIQKIIEPVNQTITNRGQGKSTSICLGADFFDLLLSAIDDQNQPFSDQEIKEEALTFVLAGSEITGNLMVWMLYVLMTHNDVLQACREEVNRVLSNGIEPPNRNLSELVVCEAVINETLRLYPLVPFMFRQYRCEHTIGTKYQLRIPKRTTVSIISYILHHRSDLWLRPLEFEYTRWMRDPKTNLKPKLSVPFAYLPFAAEPRNCIGQNFALLEAKTMSAMFIQRCNVELVPGQKIVPDIKITMRPKYGLWANVTKRQF